MRKLLSVLLFLLPPAVVAQVGTRVSGPLSGTVFDRSAGALRHMVGVPGASYLGDVILGGLEAAAVSPDGELALATSEGRLLLVSGLKLGTPSTSVIEALAGDRFVWSPGGSSAAVYSSRAGQAQVLRDLRSNPAAGALIEAGNSVSALAISDAGDLAVATDAGVSLMAAGAAPRLLAPVSSASALALRGRDLFAGAAGQIWLIENFASSAAASVFVDELGTVVGLQISADAKRLFAADATNRQVRAYDLATRANVGQVELDCVPSELRAFGDRNIWLLNSDTNGQESLYIATGTGDPAAWFVPSGRVQ